MERVLLIHIGTKTYWRISAHDSQMQAFLLGEAKRKIDNEAGEMTVCFREEILKEYAYVRSDGL